MTRFGSLLKALADGGVDFVLIGGVAGVIHGVARITYDVDIVYSRDRANLERLVKALGPLSPYLRGAPPGLPFHFDVRTLERGLNFTLTTAVGDIDLLGEAAGGGTFATLVEHSMEVGAFGVIFRCVTLNKLIDLKRAAGRPKDLEAIAELEALLENREV